jgi:regulatory protein
MEGNVHYRQVLKKAMAMCSQSERCRLGVIAKLRLWGLSEQEISMAIDYLVKERFLDEERFVDFYIHDKLRLNKWGKIKLVHMLRQKQIPEELIRSALSCIDDELYEKILYDLLKAKIKSVKGLSDYERSGKLAMFAQSHGFEVELAFEVAGQIIRADENNE